MTMRAPSSEREADEIASELEKMPRTRAVADRLQALIDDQFTPSAERDRWIALMIAVDFDVQVRHEQTDSQFLEWQDCVPGLVDPVVR